MEDIDDRKKVNKKMFFSLKSVNDFKTKYSERDWKAIAYEDYDDWNALIKATEKFISSENINIAKFEKEQQQLVAKEREIKEKEEIQRKNAEQQQRRLDAEKQRKAEEELKRQEEKDKIKQAQEQLTKQLEKEKEFARTIYQKIVNDLKEIVFRLQAAKLKFETENPNNLAAKEALLRKYTAIFDEYFAYKQTVEPNQWKYVLVEWGITIKDLETEEKVMASLVSKFTKEVETIKIQKEKEKQQKEKREAERQAITNKIKDLDEEISDLYLENEREEIRDAMTISQRTKLYEKILKVYNKYLDTKKYLSAFEYKFIFDKNPEWEIFDRINNDYIKVELKLIEKQKKKEEKKKEAKKTIPEYTTKEEVEALSKDELRKFLIAFNVITDEGLIYANVPPPVKKGEEAKGRQDIRWAYNAYNRKYWGK